MNERVKTWIYATRPHTLGASIAPMLIVLGSLVDEDAMQWGIYFLCFLVALSAQIASNLANDYFGFKSGEDTPQRLGFRRLLSSGEVTQKEMKWALVIAMSLCAIAGISIVALSGWELLIIGGLVLFATIAYSAGTFSLARIALGDLAVVLFYGFIPILATYYAVASIPPLYLVLLSLGIGMWEDNILVCNNYRDFDEDNASGKKTLIVRMGEDSGPLLYLINSISSFILIVAGLVLEGSYIGAMITSITTLVLFGNGVLAIKRLHGRSLNKLLKYTNIVSIIIGVTIMLSLII